MSFTNYKQYSIAKCFKHIIPLSITSATLKGRGFCNWRLWFFLWYGFLLVIPQRRFQRDALFQMYSFSKELGLLLHFQFLVDLLFFSGGCNHIWFVSYKAVWSIKARDYTIWRKDNFLNSDIHMLNIFSIPQIWYPYSKYTVDSIVVSDIHIVNVLPIRISIRCRYTTGIVLGICWVAQSTIESVPIVWIDS